MKKKPGNGKQEARIRHVEARKGKWETEESKVEP